MKPTERIYVAGHQGMIGQALLKRLQTLGFSDLITRTHDELDLLDQAAVKRFFEKVRPAYVFLAAGKTGGVYANDTYRADFIYENLEIQNHIIHHSFLYEVRKLIFFSCSCIYPKFCPQPMKEEHILSSALEPTNEPFAIAKIAGMKMCESYRRQYGCDFVSIIPTNTYGEGQNYTPLNSLIVPSLISRFHEAKLNSEKSVSVWGSGRPMRDFIFADDVADAALFLMQQYSDIAPVNVGSGVDLPISEVARIIAESVGFKGSIEYDASMPDGVLVKLQDVSRITAMGWKPKVPFKVGIERAYRDYLQSLGDGKGLKGATS